MTDTDLITAGGSAEEAELPNTVNNQFSSPEKPDVTHPAPAAEESPAPAVDKRPRRP